MRFKPFECVRSKIPLSWHGTLSGQPVHLPAGEVGTIMEIRGDVYEVEFIWPYGDVVDGDIFYLRDDGVEAFDGTSDFVV